MMAGHDELAHQPLGVPWHATQLGELSMLAVGAPLDEDNQVMILTDTSQGGYRRLAIVDDRLVGYLSVGTAQPDSLAIKHIIDEGHSIRDMLNTLLKGNLMHVDISRNKNLMQSKSGLLDSYRYQTVNAILLLKPLACRHTDPVVPVLITEQTEALLMKASAKNAISSLEEQSSPSILTDEGQLEQYAVYEEEPSPFTGTLPVVFGHNKNIDGCLFLKEEGANIPKQREPIVEEIGPFTGNLPAISGQIVESQKQSMKSQTRPTRKLWAYVENRA